MKKKLIIALIAFVFLTACNEDDGIHLGKNVYLMHNGDDIHSGYFIEKKIDEHNSEILISENVIEVYSDSAHILIKSKVGESLTYFYKIILKENPSKRPNVKEFNQFSYNEMVKNCTSCKRIEVLFDTASDKWLVTK